MRWTDDLAVLPEPEWRVELAGRGNREEANEYVAVANAVEALCRVAIERKHAKAAGRFMAAYALLHQGVDWLWADNGFWFRDESVELSPEEGRAEEARCRAFLVSGVRGRPRRLLRAEARGIVHALRWAHRAGLITGPGAREASRQSWLRSPEGQARMQRIAS